MEERLGGPPEDDAGGDAGGEEEGDVDGVGVGGFGVRAAVRGAEEGEGGDPVVVEGVLLGDHPAHARADDVRRLDALAIEGHGIPGISEVDTRYLTRKLREQGGQVETASNGKEAGWIMSRTNF